MNDTQLILGAISLGVSLFALLGVWQFILRPTSEDVYQQRLDSFRSVLLIDCLNHSIDSKHRAYQYVVSLIDFASTEVPKLSYLRIAFSPDRTDAELLSGQSGTSSSVLHIIQAEGEKGLTVSGITALMVSELEILDLATGYLHSRAPIQRFVIWSLNSLRSWLRAEGNAVAIGRWHFEQRAIQNQFGLVRATTT